MKDDFLKFVDKFYSFFDMKYFDPENNNHKRIVQKRIKIMMSTPIMNKWINQNIWFGKDQMLTNEVLQFLIDSAVEYFDDDDFNKNIKFNSDEWIFKLDVQISRLVKKN